MTEQVDMIIYGIGQLCTMPLENDGPQRGEGLGNLGLIEDGTVAIHNGVIAAIGTRAELEGRYVAAEVINAEGKLVTPGLIDPHTHAVWAGHRADEFERRIGGTTYQEIMAEGGGINATMRATRQASLAQLIDESKPRLMQMLRHGTTTAEVKTGYGLNTDTELNMLNAIAVLDTELPIDLAATFLGAHAIPPEYLNDTEGYVDLVVEEMIPAVAAWKEEHWPDTLFCDVFCETGAFSRAQSQRILEAGKAAGMGLKIHSDEFDPLGGTGMAVELGATSADHLVATTMEEIEMLGQSDTVAVSMPPTPFGLAHPHYTPAQEFIAAGAALAIATDCNPGTAWCENMQMVLALATRYLRLTQAQALACATVNAAFAIERGGEIGTLAEGALADVVVWQVDDYRHLGYRFGGNLVHQVIKQGNVVFTQQA